MTTRIIVEKTRPSVDMDSLDDMFAEKADKHASPDEASKMAEIQAYIDQNPWIYDIID